MCTYMPQDLYDLAEPRSISVNAWNPVNLRPAYVQKAAGFYQSIRCNSLNRPGKDSWHVFICRRCWDKVAPERSDKEEHRAGKRTPLDSMD